MHIPEIVAVAKRVIEKNPKSLFDEVILTEELQAMEKEKGEGVKFTDVDIKLALKNMHDRILVQCMEDITTGGLVEAGIDENGKMGYRLTTKGVQYMQRDRHPNTQEPLDWE